MTLSPRAADFRMVRLQLDGESWTPILSRTGQMLDPDQVAALAAIPDAEANGRRRLVKFVAADEGSPRPGSPSSPTRLDLERFHFIKGVEPIPLTLGDGEFPIGLVEALELTPPGSTPETVGYHLIAVARFADSVLGTVAWEAARNGVLSGACVLLMNVEGTGEWHIASVKLAELAEVCLPNARVLELWEERPAA